MTVCGWAQFRELKEELLAWSMLSFEEIQVKSATAIAIATATATAVSLRSPTIMSALLYRPLYYMRHPFDTGCQPLGYSGNPGVNSWLQQGGWLGAPG